MTRVPMPAPDTPGANIIRHRVCYAEVDRMGYVYYGNHPTWFERGRVELMRQHGVSYRDMEDTGFFLPVRQMKVRYHQPPRYDDLVLIVTAFGKAKRASLTFFSNIYHEDGSTLLAEGEVELACVTREGSPQPFPPALRKTLDNAERGETAP